MADWFGQAMIDAVQKTDPIKRVPTKTGGWPVAALMSACSTSSTNRVALELLLAWFATTLHIRQPADTVPLQATMQRRACEMGNRCL